MIELPMHGPKGLYVTFSDVLQCASEALKDTEHHRWMWRLLEFSGTGKMPDGLSVAEFGQATDSSPDGVLLDWSSLLGFASGVEQTHDLLLVAVEDEIAAAVPEVGAGSPLTIQAIDSTEWIVSARPDSVDLASFERLKKRTLG